MNEFDMIERYFAPLALDGLKDDAVILNIPEGQELVLSTDILNEGVHFLRGESSHHIAHKALRVNLSDIAAMGAQPYAYQLGLALPKECNEAWIKAFAAALKADQDDFGLKLSGGDTTSTHGLISISITIMGLVPQGRAIKRSGAEPGDLIMLSGFVGDALIGLKILEGKLKTKDDDYFVERYRLPTPRTKLAPIMHQYGKAAADISDGLVADLAHIVKASDVKAVIALENIEFSPQAQKLLKQGHITVEELLTGGDDYELLIVVKPADLDIFMQEAHKVGVSMQSIGMFEEGGGVDILNKSGEKIQFNKTGWQHF